MKIEDINEIKTDAKETLKEFIEKDTWEKFAILYITKGMEIQKNIDKEMKRTAS